MIRISIAELLDFHDRKGTPDDYSPSVRLGDLREFYKRAGGEVPTHKHFRCADCGSVQDACASDCASMLDVAREVLCRAFEEDPADLMQEWLAFYRPEQWLWWGRGLGAFIAHKRRAIVGAPEVR